MTEDFRVPIPRPDAARPGGPPPWADRPPGPVTVDDVRRAVTGHPDLPALPGDEHGPNSAVLAAIWEEDGEARVLLTRRGSWLRSHSGQVAFPGGRVDEGETLLEAALREAQEEVALDPSSVEVIGRLSRMHTISSGAGIYPFVGILPGRPEVDPNPDEVARVFDVALRDLMAEDVFHEEIWGIPSQSDAGTERPIYFFELDGETIWGATARMLYELLLLLIGRRPPPMPAPLRGPEGGTPPARA